MRNALTVGIMVVVLVAASTWGPAVFSRSLSAQPAGFHVLTVPSGGVTCADMTSNLRTDSESWRVFYTTYMAGFITGANFVTYSDSGRNSNVGYDVPTGVLFSSIQRYCEQNGGKNISEAVTRVYSQHVAR